MTVIDFYIAMIEIFWLPILIFSAGICLATKAIFDEIQYYRWLNKDK